MPNKPTDMGVLVHLLMAVQDNPEKFIPLLGSEIAARNREIRLLEDLQKAAKKKLQASAVDAHGE